MITKNEADNLPRSLGSVQGLVDELVVVDTGSEDKTVDLAREYGAKVYNFIWQNDFAAARNFALDKAEGEWILFLDADEELQKIDKDDLKHTLQQAKEEGFFVNIINFGDNKNNLKSFALRLFRNNPSYRYEGKIHEQIFSTIQNTNPQATFSWIDLEIHHYGYLSDQIKAKNKTERNIELLLNETPEVKETSFYCFNLGMEYLRIGKFTEAEKWFKKGWQKVRPSISFAHRLISKLIICLSLQEKYAEAIGYCQKGEEYYPNYADLYYYHGLCLIKTNHLEEARRILIKGLEKGESPAHYISEAGCGSYRNLEALGTLEEKCLNFNLATMYYSRAFRLQSQDLYYLIQFLRNLVKSNFNFDTRNYLLDIISYGSNEILLLGGELLFDLGKYDLVNDILALKINDINKSSDVLLHAKNFLMLGNFNKALDLLNQIPADDKLKKDAVFYVWVTAWLKINPTLAEKSLREMFILDFNLGKVLGELQKYLVFGSWEKGQVKGLKEENISTLMIIIETFAVVLGSSQLLERTIEFARQVVGEEVLPLIAKILYKQKLYSQSLELFKQLDDNSLDVESALALVELEGEDEPVKAGKILSNIIKQNLALARPYLMGMDIWLKAAGRANISLQKKIAGLKGVPPLC